MTVILLAEGATEKALKGKLKAFLDQRAEAESKPKVALQGIVIERNRGKLRGQIRLLLRSPKVTAVVGLIDVYPDFADAASAKKFLCDAANGDTRFYAHAAQYDVEAWLLPYWDSICRSLRVNRARPGSSPEMVNRERPPSKVLDKLYRLAKPPRKYIKPIDMDKILRDQDLTLAANQCPELKSLLNTLLGLNGLNRLL